MKNQLSFFALLVTSLSSTQVFSQCPPSKTAADSLSCLYSSYFELSGKYAELNNSFKKVSEDFQQVDKRVNDNYDKVSTDFEKAKKNIEDKLGETFDKIQIKEKEKLEKDVLNTASFIRSANGGLNAISSQLANVQWLNEITSLNNATNDELGFSIKNVFKTLIEKHIKPKVGNKDADRVNKFVTGIIDNPITDIAKGVFPIINSVTNFLSGITFNKKDISETDFDNLMKELTKYTEHYEKLDFATIEFKNGIGHLQTRRNALQTILNNFIKERTSKTSEYVEENDINVVLTKFYKNEYLTKELGLITQNSTTYEIAILKLKNLHPSTTVNQIQFIKDELNYLTNQYLAAVDAYQKQILAIINASNGLIIGDVTEATKKRNAKIEKLNSTFNNSKIEFSKAVNMQDVTSEYEQLINNK